MRPMAQRYSPCRRYDAEAHHFGLTTVAIYPCPKYVEASMGSRFFSPHIDILLLTGQSIFRRGAVAYPRNDLTRTCVFMRRLKFSRFHNWFLALRSYSDLRPDLAMRRRINRQILADRPAHTGSEWYRKFWAPRGVSREVATFIYRSLAQYSGLQWAKVLPTDRLCEDLKLPLICWFDWELSLCEDFYQEFGLELDDYLDVTQLNTVADLMGFFNQCMLSKV